MGMWYVDASVPLESVKIGDGISLSSLTPMPCSKEYLC